ncbi:unnamed protein product [Nippostrongylus brasiliensis]|uniref:C2H2-type domain-containing protein n=1 Tax=Nippostrongylus brasiliensis TaxID=27835 RepID=A0A0N4XYR0_NIPBR|nr:unnamed protein product [Nippostrongylus brasiliensis]
MVSFVLVEAETQEVLMNLIQYLTNNSLKFTVASDIRRLFARTYLDIDGACAADVSSSSGDNNILRSDINISSGVPSQFSSMMPNLFGVMATKAEPSELPFRWLSAQSGGNNESMQQSDVICDTTPYLDSYPSASTTNSLENRAHQIFAADGSHRAQKRSWHQSHNTVRHYTRDSEKFQGNQVQASPTIVATKVDESDKKEKMREVACQLCGKRITMRRCNLRHHAAVVHSGIERYACRCGYTTVHRNTIIRHMLKHAGVESEKNYEFTDMLTPAEAEQIEKLTEECFREYRTVPRGNEDPDEMVRTMDSIASVVEVHNQDIDRRDEQLDDVSRQASCTQ